MKIEKVRYVGTDDPPVTLKRPRYVVRDITKQPTTNRVTVGRSSETIYLKTPYTEVSPGSKTCPACRRSFTPKRSDAVTCSPRCRTKLYRTRILAAAGR